MDNLVTIKEEIIELTDRIYEPLSTIGPNVNSRTSSNSDSLSSNGDGNNFLSIYNSTNCEEELLKPGSRLALDYICKASELSSQPSIEQSGSDYNEFYSHIHKIKSTSKQVQNDNCVPDEEEFHFSTTTSNNITVNGKEMPGIVKVEITSDQEDEGSVQLECEEISLSNICHNIKEELDMDIIKEEVEDTSVVQMRCEDHQTVINSEFYFPRIKEEKILIETVSRESPICETNGDDDKVVNLQLTKSVKEKAKLLYQTLMNFISDDGRRIIAPFLEMPVQELDPNYYELVNNPMDMKTVLSKIKCDSYSNLNETESDFLLMFQNAQLYYENDSQVFSDAEILRSVLHQKLQEIKETFNHKIPIKMLKQMKQLYNSVRFYRDGNQKRLSSSFVKLPLRKHFPEFYEIVNYPIDLEFILSKMNSGQYCSLRRVFDDLNLLFHNASLFYEPQSQIYRNSLTLQNIAIKKYLEIEMKNEISLDIGFLVQCMIVLLFNRVFNLQSANGKYLSNSFSKLPVFEEVDGHRRYIVSFDVLKYRLDRGFYLRLDQFQHDIFTVFEKARQFSSIDSRIYTYTVTMQKKYLTIRDEIFRHKSLVLLKSRALDFREEDFLKLLDDQKQKKLQPTKRSRPSFTKPIEEKSSMELESQSIIKDTRTSQCGEFVYVPPAKDEAGLSRICQILSISFTSTGGRVLHGYQFMRAVETHYKPWQKFYDNEVFRTERRFNIPEAEVLGKCVVLSENQYKNCVVENFDQKDVYVCITRYNSLLRRYSKAKNWSCELPESIKLINRNKPIEMTPQCLSFPQGMEKRKILLAELELNATVATFEQNILKPLDKTIDGHLFYLQYSTSFGVFKLGDFVYVDGSGQKSIIHINRIYSTKDEKKFVVGLRYMLASDIPVSIKGLQQEYKKEVYFTAIQQTHSMEDIIGRCSVLTIKDYIKKRCVEIKEEDVYLCRSHFDEQKQTVTPLQGDIIKYNLPSTVQPDEIYFFITPLDIDRIEKSDCWQHNHTNKKIKFCKTKSITSVEKNFNKSDVSGEKVGPAMERKNNKASNKLQNIIKIKTSGERNAILDSVVSATNNNKVNLSPGRNIVKKRFPYDRNSIKNRLIIEKKKSNHKLVLSPRKKSIKSDTTLPNCKISGVDTSTKRFLQTRKKFQGHEISKMKKKYPQKLMKNFKSITGKCPKSGYLIFCSEIRKSITEKSPGVSFSDIGKAMGVEWNNLSEKKKKEYQEKAKVINLQLLNEIRDRPEKSNGCINGKLTRKFIGNNKKNIKLNGEAKSFKVVGGKKPVRAFIHFVSKRKNELNYDNFNDLTQMLIIEWAEQSVYSKRCHRLQALKMNTANCTEIKNTQINGYALFCAEMRKIVRAKYPNAKIGLVTHLLKIEWIHLPERQKEYYQSVASMWETDSDEVEHDFMGFTEHDYLVQNLQVSSVNDWEEPDSDQRYCLEENAKTTEQENINKRKLKFNNNSYFFFQSERFKELKKLYPDKHSSDIYLMTSQEWKKLSKEVKLDYQKRMKEQIFIQSLSRATTNEDEKNSENVCFGDYFPLEQLIKQEIFTPKTEQPGFIQPTVYESLQTVKGDAHLPQLKYTLPTKPPDYAAFNLKSCRVIMKPLGIPLDSEKSFMINDMEGGFVFLVRPSDQISYLKEKFNDSREGSPQKSKRIKPYMCDICGKCYRRRDSLSSHKKKHKSKCFFRCKLCKPRKHFDSNCEFINHMDEYHEPNWRKKHKFLNFIKQEALHAFFADSTTIESNFTEVLSSNLGAGIHNPAAISAVVKMEEPNPDTDNLNKQFSDDRESLKQASSPSSTNSSGFSFREMDPDLYIKMETSDSFYCGHQAYKNEFSSPNNSVMSSENVPLERDIKFLDNELFCSSQPSSLASSGNTITIHSTPSGGIVVDGIDINDIPDKNAKNITVNIGTLECSYPIIIDANGKRISPNNSYPLYPVVKNSSLPNIIVDGNLTAQHSECTDMKGPKINAVVDQSIEHIVAEFNYETNGTANCLTILDPNLGPCAVLNLFQNADLDSNISNGFSEKNFIGETSTNTLLECNVNNSSVSHIIKVNTGVQSAMPLSPSSFNHRIISSKLSSNDISTDSKLSQQSLQSASSNDLCTPIVIRSNSSCNAPINSAPHDKLSSNLGFVNGLQLLNGCSDIKQQSIDDAETLKFGTNGYSIDFDESSISTKMSLSSATFYEMPDKIVTSNNNLSHKINIYPSGNVPEGQHPHYINDGCLKVLEKKDMHKPHHRTSSSGSHGSNYDKMKSAFPCSKCPKIFTKKSEYNKHFFEHSGSATKSFKCSKCNDTFTIVFNRESYLIWNKKKSKPVCTKCHQISSNLI